jgi:nicotinamide mononucleotide transporter
MDWIELLASLLGLANVALVVRRSVWNYPFGLAMVAIYCVVFFERRLYSDSLLQIFFFVVQIYGWRNWVVARREAGEVPVLVLGWPARFAWLAGAAAFALLWGYGMDRFTDAAAPYPDAAIAGTSVAAQILMAQRRIENWVLWILVDSVAVGLFWSRGLVYTSPLYAIFLLLSIAGLIDWRRSLLKARAAR